VNTAPVALKTLRCALRALLSPRRRGTAPQTHLHLHGHTLHGSQQVTTAAGMGIVALGAGAALFLRRTKRA
jgi:LPXTG-motif cell wall-anchored protein